MCVGAVDSLRIGFLNTQEVTHCNTPKYTLVVFDMFRVFCKPNLTIS